MRELPTFLDPSFRKYHQSAMTHLSLLSHLHDPNQLPLWQQPDEVSWELLLRGCSTASLAESRAESLVAAKGILRAMSKRVS